jgi:phage tail tape-measure protein
MTIITCENCRCEFDSTKHSLGGSAATAGALTGALLGVRVGFAGGPWVAIGGAVVGGLLAGAGGERVSKCPCCDKTTWR